MPSKARYDERKAAGVCTVCGNFKPVPGRAKCESCAKREADARAERRNEIASAGKCPRCEKRKPAKDRKFCKPCLDAEAERQATIAAANAAEPAPAEPTAVLEPIAAAPDAKPDSAPGKRSRSTAPSALTKKTLAAKRPVSGKKSAKTKSTAKTSPTSPKRSASKKKRPAK